jgi:hypothetical protein
MNKTATADFSDRKTLEKYSSAFTLSDMEVFIFPELFFPLVLANIISPALWSWKDDPWFYGIEKKGFTYRVNRIKQYIIQNYIFNLDLSTWGLTTKQREIERFSSFFDMDLIKKSNALFGYEGDRYYFDIDIRKHFGLDKFNSDVIPYWKTETIEAMNAFRYKENFHTGAGECVSLSALYASAMFVVGRIPLEKIFLIATPLHSQNFITEKEGLITNNRRIVTKNMWYNGTSLSAKARRALENEKVTIVTHISGFIHTIYKEATIDKKAYSHFSARLRDFLSADLTDLIFINFLRFNSKYKSLFQFECECSGKKRYISLEKLFEYEHNSRFHVSRETREQLILEIEGEEFHLSPMQGKILLNEAEDIIGKSHGKRIDEIEEQFIKIKGGVAEYAVREMFTDLKRFIFTEPRLPDTEREFISTPVPAISTKNSREEIIEEILRTAGYSEVSRIALYVFRQMDQIDWLPYIKAAVERNPVCLNDLKNNNIDEIMSIVASLPGNSIYDDKRLALPDEVWNFRRGDGIEKAILSANVIMNRDAEAEVEIKIGSGKAVLGYNGRRYDFATSKQLSKIIKIRKGIIEIV